MLITLRARRFVQEPAAAFALVNPILDETGRRHVAVSITHIVGEAKEPVSWQLSSSSSRNISMADRRSSSLSFNR